ncbi:aminopeptidase N [Desulfobacula toluolica]|uniref:Aminopeptidase N n=1 Tax=Desulfobacula toluolica (strain DSM 7467 / Tol2) TaxID=651182 RepID=K0N980_DESTT|nr:aminopeptidase N [Desulfobacula toluolica]CCK80499.1 PepN: membrane alanyl aminopeptidase (aminopeptidase N) [Desulfobacula toluolica Tol2]
MEEPKTIYLKDYKPAEFIVDRVDLTFDIKDNQTKVTSILNIHKNFDIADKNTSLVFDKGDFEISSVIANGMLLLPEEYESGGGYFKLARTPDIFDLEIISILKPEENTSLEGLYKSGDIFCTQCEAQGFRKITPFPDRPDIMAVYSCTIIADKTQYPVLLSNGNLVDSGDLDNNRHFVRWEDPFKKPSYLFALVAGDLEHIHDQFTTKSGRNVDLKIYSERENIDKCYHAMKSLKQAMEWDEKRFGLEYDLDLYQIVAINDFNAGAMENKGLNIFNSKYVLANPETATDEDFLNIQGVIGHEYFHNWTGNRVTLKNWFQLSLKEGLTVFRDQEFSSDLNSRGVKRISCVRNLRGSQFPEDAGPMTHPVRPDSYIKMDNFYTMTVYEKGSELIRMIHQLIGEKKFRKAIDLYFEKFDGMAVTIEDFIGVMEEAGGLDLNQFKLWYFQSGTPTVKVERSYNPDLKQLAITFEQHIAPDRNQSKKKPLHIPVKFAIIDNKGNDITPESKSLLELTSGRQTFVFGNIPENSLPSLFRQFSAPVKIKTDFTNEELAFLMANDPDEFNRWDAAQTLFVNELKRIITAIQADKELSVSPNLIKAFKKALLNQHTDHAFLAKALSLPMETEIKNHFDLVDVHAIHRGRLFLKQQIAKQLKQHFMDLIDYCSKSDPLSLSHGAMADRSLKNLSLSYLGCLKETDTTQLVLRHYATAKNMTDEIAAFKILSEIHPDIKQTAVKNFYSKWQHDKLVLDKWFAVQAGSSLPNTLNIVKSLIKHPDFSIKNPNKVRSLIYMFAMQNHINFHQKNGDGYRFIADQIIALDKINHQIAARLSSCFNQMKRYDNARKIIIKKELERILCVPTLSKNVYEIVSRALE